MVSGDVVLLANSDLEIRNITGDGDAMDNPDSITLIFGDLVAVGTATSSGTTVDFGAADHGLVVGDVFGVYEDGGRQEFRTVVSVTNSKIVEVDRAFATNLLATDSLKKQGYGHDWDVTITGFIGGGGLTNISIHADGSITLGDGATISSRQVAAGENHWNATSGDSGNIILKAPTITVGEGANILAHSTTGNAGDVRLISYEKVDKTWSFLGIDDFGWRSSEASIDIGMGARLTGDDISIWATAWTQKILDAKNDPEFSFPTRSVVLADVDSDKDLDLLVGNYNKPNRLYLNDGTGKFVYGVEIDTTKYHTTSLAAGDIDGDSKIELVIGNYDESRGLGESIRLYEWNSTDNKFDAGTDIGDSDKKTTAITLANVDADANLELIVGTDKEGIFLYDWTGSAFGSPTQIESATTYQNTSLAIADVDNDSDRDLVVGNYLSKEMTEAIAGWKNEGESDSAYYYVSSTNVPTKVFRDGSPLTKVEAKTDLDGADEWWYDPAQERLYTYGDPTGHEIRGSSANGESTGQAIRFYKNNGSGFDAGVDLDTTTRKTTALVLGNVDNDSAIELIVGTDGEGILQYEYNGTGFVAGTPIDSTAYGTTSLALADVDADSDLDLVVGNKLQQNRLYLNDGSGNFTGENIGIETYPTTSLALGDVDKASVNNNLELVVGIDRLPNRLYSLKTIEGTTGEEKTGYVFGKDIGVNSQLVSSAAASQDNLDYSTGKAKAVVAESEASIAIGAGAYLDAAHDVIFSSLSHSDVQMTTVRSGWGVTYGNSSATATIHVENGADISATNLFQMHANVENTVNLIAFIPALGESTNLAFSLAIGHSTSLADIRSGAEIEAVTADIFAKNLNSFANTAIAAGFGTKAATDKDTEGSKDDDTGTSATVALGFFQSSAIATVSGGMDIDGDLTIHGESVNERNVTRSFASVSGNPVGKYAQDIADFTDSIPFVNGIGIGDSVLKARTGETKKGYAVALAMVTSDNKASALISDGAVITVGGDLDITSLAQDSFQISASGSAGTVPGSGLEKAYGGALVYSKVANQANAFVGWNAVADVTGTLTIDADATMLSPVDTLDLVLALTGFGEATQTEALAAAYAYSEKMGGKLANALGSPMFEAYDFTDLNGLVLKLRAHPADSVSEFLWNGFSSDTQTLLNDPGADTEEVKKALVDELNEVIQQGSSLYKETQPLDSTKSIFDGITLRDETKALGDTDGDGDLDLDDAGLTNEADLVRFNRMLLEDAYSTEIAKRENKILKTLTDNLNDEAKTGTSFVYAGGSAASGGTTVGGGINVLLTYNAAAAGIAKGARVSADQDVKVLATGSLDSYNFAGNASVLNYATN